MSLIRVIPCLDIRGGRVVKGVRFVDILDAGDPVEAALAYCEGGADELAFLDITASQERRRTMVDAAARVAARISVPLTVGGGIADAETARELLDRGVAKVSVSSAAVRRPELISELAARFGSRCVTVAVDAKQTESGWEVYINGGREPTGLDAAEWAVRAQELGCGEILLTSIDRDGTKNGYDIPLLRAVSGAVRVPVVASGGAGRPEHFAEAVTEGGAGAVLAASLFHYGELTIAQVKADMRARGLAVRM
ncbi:MAG: imidazole glycerol phosphate synthase subunit HisF [Oscillospiraceae bacterium]|nr:imidazole glycerol phosphate synthase subunit HisF [Oscillospiraceae bacterium]